MRKRDGSTSGPRPPSGKWVKPKATFSRKGCIHRLPNLHRVALAVTPQRLNQRSTFVRSVA